MSEAVILAHEATKRVRAEDGVAASEVAKQEHLVGGGGLTGKATRGRKSKLVGVHAGETEHWFSF